MRFPILRNLFSNRPLVSHEGINKTFSLFKDIDLSDEKSLEKLIGELKTHLNLMSKNEKKITIEVLLQQNALTMILPKELEECIWNKSYSQALWEAADQKQPLFLFLLSEHPDIDINYSFQSKHLDAYPARQAIIEGENAMVELARKISSKKESRIGNKEARAPGLATRLKRSREKLRDHLFSDVKCYKDTPLHRAAAQGDLLACKILLHHPQIDPNIRDLESMNPLERAVYASQLEVVRFFLEEGTAIFKLNFKKRNLVGFTLLEMAIHHQEGDLIDFLLHKKGVSSLGQLDMDPMRLSIWNKGWFVDLWTRKRTLMREFIFKSHPRTPLHDTLMRLNYWTLDKKIA